MLALSDPSPQQRQIMKAGKGFVNRGRIVMLTHITDGERLKVSSTLP